MYVSCTYYNSTSCIVSTNDVLSYTNACKIKVFSAEFSSISRFFFREDQTGKLSLFLQSNSPFFLFAFVIESLECLFILDLL